MTPPRLSELQCPSCGQVAWVIDSDHRGIGGVMQRYDERRYVCARCGHDGPGWKLEQQSPFEFLSQPHDMYPMTQADFDHWIGVLRTHFPAHPRLNELGTTFYPRLPEEVEAMRADHARAHPVLEMIDQDGARRAEPDSRTAWEWLEIMAPGDSLVFRRRDGATLHVSRDNWGLAARYCDMVGVARSEFRGLDDETVRGAIRRYLQGETSGRVSPSTLSAFRRRRESFDRR